MIDGLLLPGSNNDIPAEVYGSERKPEYSYSKNTTLFNYQKLMVLKANKRGMPILGLCNGSNVLNLIFGGSIEQSIAESNHGSGINHDIYPLKGEMAHSVDVKKGTHLHDIITGSAANQSDDIQLQVTSWHHAGNKEIASSLVVSATAPDGVIEGVEQKFPGHTNCWGIQFHPEYVNKDTHPVEHARQTKVLSAFAKACLAYHAKTDFNKVLLTQFSQIKGKLRPQPPSSSAVTGLASVTANPRCK